MVAPVGLKQYPSSTPDGLVIPSDIGYPYGLYIDSIGAAAVAVKLPADVIMASIFCTVRGILMFTGDPAVATEGSFLENALIIPANRIVHVALPSNLLSHIRAEATSGKIYIQCWKPWQATGVEALKQRT